ncbi:MAG: hypothetical protein RI953_2948 [Pseudomonadota bacterium]|jgi:cytochrome c553
MKTLQLSLESLERESVFVLRAGLTVVLALVLAGCNGVKKDEPDLSTFKGLYTSYLKDCGQCHSPDNIAYKENVKNLDMTSEDAAYNSLKSNASIARLAGLGCDSLKYVEPGSASTSILYAIMDASTAESFSGACKPLRHTKADGGEANNPTAEQKQKIKEWIDKGAPRN